MASDRTLKCRLFALRLLTSVVIMMRMRVIIIIIMLGRSGDGVAWYSISP